MVPVSSTWLAIMGSGETTPTMTKHHRRLLDAAPAGPRTMLDSPYGFQENADDITARTRDYFSTSLVTTVEAATLRSPDADARTVATALDASRRSPWLYAGPGSPTYAMRVWSAAGLSNVIADRLRSGSGQVTVFSSAAALTLGVSVVPVYEIYKVGADPFWMPGLDVFRAATGLDAVVIPHFDNAEGGNHDTRFCYLGERRLQTMESMLEASTWVFGVDEHTAVLIELETGHVEVVGRGGLTVRVQGKSTVMMTGSVTTLDAIAAVALGGPASTNSASSARRADASSGDDGSDATGRHAGLGPDAGDPDGESTAGLGETAEVAERTADTALAARSTAEAVDAALLLERALEEWKGDTSTTDERDRARAALHRIIVRLGALATDGVRDPADVLGPVIQIVLGIRTQARLDKDFRRSDELRDALAAIGVEVRDTPSGQTWSFVQPSAHSGA
jgi:hypothetical protein